MALDVITVSIRLTDDGVFVYSNGETVDAVAHAEEQMGRKLTDEERLAFLAGLHDKWARPCEWAQRLRETVGTARRGA